jgi:hypothetical protein
MPAEQNACRYRPSATLCRAQALFRKTGEEKATADGALRFFPQNLFMVSDCRGKRLVFLLPL